MSDRATTSRRLGRRPALDGIRGVAWTVVFFSHALTLPIAMGQAAMFVFFALSGFLITALLLEERATTGRISLANFFARRALRLLPALVFFLVAWLAVVLATRGHAPWTTTVPGGDASGGHLPVGRVGGRGAALVYVTNWADIEGWFTSYVPLGHLWSLAVEEQFYLLWSPVVVVLLARRSRVALGWVAAAAALASFVDVGLRGGAGISLAVDMGTDTRAGAFLVGAALAVLWSRQPPWLGIVQGQWRRATVAGTMLVLAWGSWAFDHPVSAPVFMGTWVAVSLASGLLVIAYLGERVTGGLVGTPVAGFVGRRSYGLYLWHYAWLTWLAGMGLVGVPLALAATGASAELSWRLVERPALARKHRFTADRTPAPTPAPALDDGPAARTPTLVSTRSGG